MGCGGVGGWIAAELTRAGHDVLPVTHNPEIAAAINQHGFRQRQGDRIESVPGQAVAKLGDERDFDIAFLATQPAAVVSAALSAIPSLAPQAPLVCLQNGLCEGRVIEVAGADRVIGAVVGWGASMPAPGEYDRTSEGGFTIGRLDRVSDPRLDTVAGILAPIGEVRITQNLLGARWSKLAINCAISGLGTIGGERLGKLIRHRFVRRLAIEIMTEVCQTTDRLGIDLEKISGTFDPHVITLDAADLDHNSPRLMMKHALLLGVGARFRRLRSSMLAAIERGREPAVDYLNGEVVRHGASVGVLTPVNHRVQQTIHAIARGELASSVDLLHRLYRESRQEVRHAASMDYEANAADRTVAPNARRDDPTIQP